MPALQQIGIQLFSLPRKLEEDFDEGMSMLSHMGYKELELYGPFPFSVEKAKKSWEAVTPQLGFQGSGFFGLEAKAIKAKLDSYGLKIIAAHLDLDTLHHNMPQVGEISNMVGIEYVGISLIPAEMRTSLDDYKRTADVFNNIGEKAKQEGLKFIYHNHGYGLQEIDGNIPLNMILDQTDPTLVFFEMDIFWTTAGGADPIHYLTSYPGRYSALHLKDMKPIIRFSGDGGTPDQWMALFPYMNSVGNGDLDILGIITAAREAGVKHFFVEQDIVAQPEIALKESIDYLKAI